MNEDGHAVTVALSWQAFRLAAPHRRNDRDAFAPRRISAGRLSVRQRWPAGVPALRPVFLLITPPAFAGSRASYGHLPRQRASRAQGRRASVKPHSLGRFAAKSCWAACTLYEYYHTIRPCWSSLTLQDNGIPIYVQLRDQIAAAIGRGGWRRARGFPPCAKSRWRWRSISTPCSAPMPSWSEDGLLTMVQGRGTFVAEAPPPRNRERRDPTLAAKVAAQAQAAGRQRWTI